MPISKEEQALHQRLYEALRFRTTVYGHYWVWQSADRVSLCFHKHRSAEGQIIGSGLLFGSAATGIILLSGGSWVMITFTWVAVVILVSYLLLAYRKAPQNEEFVGCTLGDFPRMEVALTAWTARPQVDVVALALRKVDVDQPTDEVHPAPWFLYARLRDGHFLPIHCEPGTERYRTGFLHAVRDFATRIGLPIMESQQHRNTTCESPSFPTNSSLDLQYSYTRTREPKALLRVVQPIRQPNKSPPAAPSRSNLDRTGLGQ